MMTLLGIQSHAGMLVYCILSYPQNSRLGVRALPPFALRRGQPREEGNRVLHWHRAVE